MQCHEAVQQASLCWNRLAARPRQEARQTGGLPDLEILMTVETFLKLSDTSKSCELGADRHLTS